MIHQQPNLPLTYLSAAVIYSTFLGTYLASILIYHVGAGWSGFRYLK